MNYRFNENVQLYSYFWKGFNSNDTRVAVVKTVKSFASALGTDFGEFLKLAKLILQSAVWYLWLDQEFVYVGDEAVVEGGKTERKGIDITARHEIYQNWFCRF